MNLFTKQKQIHRLKEWSYRYRGERVKKEKTSLVIDFLLGN